MTDMPFPPAARALPALDLARMIEDATLFTRAGLAMAALIVPLAAAMAIDPRQLGEVSIWMKPLKFAVSLTAYLLTIAYMARWAAPGFNRARLTRAFAALVVAAIAAEMAWIAGAAAFGTTSHFNTSTAFMESIYTLMGVLAVILTSAALVWGVAILRATPTGLGVTLGLSLIATFAATVVVAGYLGGQGGPIVGTPVTGAALPLLGWSREVGDLRPAHFLATHLMHVVPLAALLLAGRMHRITPRMGVALNALGLLCTAAIFTQALYGLPLIPA